MDGLGDAPGEIDINSGHHFWDDPAGVVARGREDGDFSTDDPRHPIAHELGELAMHQSVGGDRFYPYGESYVASDGEFQAEDLGHVLDAVSGSATANHSDYVAEVFAALLLNGEGLRQDAEIMRLYEKYGGSPIRQYDSEPSRRR